MAMHLESEKPAQNHLRLSRQRITLSNRSSGMDHLVDSSAFAAVAACIYVLTALTTVNSHIVASFSPWSIPTMTTARAGKKQTETEPEHQHRDTRVPRVGRSQR
jgi:hypothetical protein